MKDFICDFFHALLFHVFLTAEICFKERFRIKNLTQHYLLKKYNNTINKINNDCEIYVITDLRISSNIFN